MIMIWELLGNYENNDDDDDDDDEDYNNNNNNNLYLASLRLYVAH